MVQHGAVCVFQLSPPSNRIFSNFSIPAISSFVADSEFLRNTFTMVFSNRFV